MLTQITFSAQHLVRWRETYDFSGPVFAGVMVVPSPAMARKLSAEMPQLTVPEAIVRRLESDRGAGLQIAYDLICEIRDSGVFDGVHLIPVSRYREIAALLEPLR